MKLLLDVGNTRIKWAGCVDNELRIIGDVVHRDASWQNVVLFLGQISETPEAVIASNVAGETVGAALADAVRDRWALDVIFVATQPVTDLVQCGYEDHRQLGVDRWLAILAAYGRHRCAVCVVDAGTAITVDLVDRDGTHLGGYIVPGLQLMKESLHQETGDLDRLAKASSVTDGAEQLVPGRSTAAAINNGCLLVACGLIDNCMKTLQQTNEPVVLVVSGGDAKQVISGLDADADHRPHLVIEGLMGLTTAC